MPLSDILYEKIRGKGGIFFGESILLQSSVCLCCPQLVLSLMGCKNRAEQTIEILNLNCKRLCEVRRAVLKPYMTLHEKKPDRDQLKKLAASLLGNRYENGCWGIFFTMIRWRFRNIAEEYLEEIQFHG